jgi:DnaJ-class molecular chaperone
MSKNYYELLEVQNNASAEELKKSYRRLSLKYHPDKTKGDDSKFKEINEAYSILSDNQQRQEYDMRLNGIPLNQGNQMPFNHDDIMNMFFNMHRQNEPNMPGMSGIPGMPFFNIFQGNAGGGPGGMPNIQIFRNGVPVNINNPNNNFQKPTPILKTVEITLEESYNGCKKPLEIERWVIHDNIKNIEKETIYVTIPRGIDENEIIILRDLGNVVSDTIKGDIKISIKINNNTQLIREGLNLFYNKTITFKESLCGFTFDLPYFNGKSFKVNNISGNIICDGHKKMISELGMIRDEHKGNLIINFSVMYPQSLSQEQVEVLEKVL